MTIQITTQVLGVSGAKLYYRTSVDPIANCFIRASSELEAESVFYNESEFKDRESETDIGFYTEVGNIIEE